MFHSPLTKRARRTSPPSISAGHSSPRRGVPFTLHKTYVFDKDEYLFDLRITIQNSVNDFPSLNFSGMPTR